MDWIISQELVDYPYAVSEMERRVAGIRDGSMDEAVWLLEHPPLYTAGTSARAEDLLSPRFPVYDTGRGGQYTYHGPGQRVGYVILDLKKRQQTPDIKKYVWQLEEWVIRSLAEFNVQGERRAGRVGIWVDLGNGQEAKIAALGVRVRHWVTFHGVSINVDPDLSHFNGIVPCGIKEHGVTSLAQLEKNVSLQDIDLALKKTFDTIGF
ncbi:MAG: lipoate-protein ligase B [Alphaproteobacteria bacterium CG1_02_46_17]|nr:MAG: lipoate-protein ligase B [Alphaproteobacteria bacterium CG1_02_46_17]